MFALSVAITKNLKSKSPTAGVPTSAHHFDVLFRRPEHKSCRTIEVQGGDNAMPKPAVATPPVPNQHAGYGYRLTGPKGCRRRVPDLAEQAVIARIVDLRQAGTCWEQIALTLLRERITAKTGREWSISRIRRAYDAATQQPFPDPWSRICSACHRIEPRVPSEPLPSRLSHRPRICRSCRNAKRREKRRAVIEARSKRLAVKIAMALRKPTEVLRLIETGELTWKQLNRMIRRTLDGLPRNAWQTSHLADAIHDFLDHCRSTG